MQRQPSPQPRPVSLDQQKREVRASEQMLLHNFVVRETKKINGVSRRDHKIMLKILLYEAWRQDPDKKKNKSRWEKILRDMSREVDSKNSIITIAPDPYQGAMAKLSSMMVWNQNARYWTYRYWEEEIARRRSSQAQLLAKLKSQGKLFL